MDVKRSLTWLVDGFVFHLNPLEHKDLDDLYRERSLPMVVPLRSRIDRVIFDGGKDELSAVEALHGCLESFRAILVASLRKGQPWMSGPEAELVVTVYCGDEDDREDDLILFRQVQCLGKWTLEGLVSQHRERFAGLISLAEAFEAVVMMPWEGEE
ncbi:hypothetical protein ACYOEI_06715 [Singulisphaera rosea]